MGMDGGSEPQTTEFGSFLLEVAAEVNAMRSHVPALPISRTEWRRLRKAVAPKLGESLRGLVYRSCAINGLPNSWGLLQHMGGQHRNRVTVAEDANIEVAQLAHAIRVADAEVTVRRYPDLGREHVSFFGLDIHRKRIENRIRRFSPTAFRADAAARTDPSDRAYAVHRASWELRDIPFCLEHWDMLHDRCWCEGDGVVQGWTRTATHLHECDRCGEPLANFEAFPVPDDMRPALSVLKALAHPVDSIRQRAGAALPRSLRGADRSKMFAALTELVRLIEPATTDYPLEDVRDRLAGLWKACDIISRWPASAHELNFPASSPSAVRKIAFALSELTGAKGRKKKKNEVYKPVGMRRAAEIAKVSAEVVQSAWENRLVTQHRRIHGARAMIAFDRVEMEEFGENWNARVAPESLVEELGIPYHGIEQLSAMKLLVADAPALPGTGPHFYPETVEAFLTSIEAEAAHYAKSAGTIADPVYLIDAMRHVSGRAKPWGPVLGLVLGGEIPIAIEPRRNFAQSIVIQSAHIPVIAAARFDRCDYDEGEIGFRFSPTLSRRDALNLLNMGNGDARTLDGLTSRGRRPRLYSVAEVEHRAATHIGVPEIGLLLGMNPPATYRELMRQNLHEVQPGLWDRQTILAHLCRS